MTITGCVVACGAKPRQTRERRALLFADGIAAKFREDGKSPLHEVLYDYPHHGCKQLAAVRQIQSHCH